MNMFRNLLEAVFKRMIVFQELNFDPVKEILKIQCHIYILMKKVVILRKIHVKWKSFAPPQKETKNMPQLLIYSQSMRLEKLDYSKCQKQPLEVFYGKSVFFKMPQNSQEILVPEETPRNFAKFLRIRLLQNNSRTTASEMQAFQ